jgi:hypothetical protein
MKITTESLELSAFLINFANAKETFYHAGAVRVIISNRTDGSNRENVRINLK